MVTILTNLVVYIIDESLNCSSEKNAIWDINSTSINFYSKT